MSPVVSQAHAVEPVSAIVERLVREFREAASRVQECQ